MAKRSLKSSVQGRQRAKQAMERRGWTQDYLATEAGLSTRNSVWKFLSGRPVERYIFTELCFQLGLDWEEIADLHQEFPEEVAAPLVASDPFSPDYLALKSKLRHQFYKQYATVQSSFNITRQFALGSFYTDLQLLPHLSHQQWLDVDDLQQSSLYGDRLSSQPQFSLQEILENQHKLVLLGKPGSGKTTLLKYLTLQCYDSRIQAECIPLFIPLRDIERYRQDRPAWSLEDYLQQQLAIADVSSKTQTELLERGRFWLLLDALDEISRRNSESFLEKIQEFSQNFPKVSIIITSRIAAQNYFFTGFTYLEIANFNQSQIESYIRRWFSQETTIKSGDDNTKAETLITNLNQPENRDILELAKTPLLLELICCAFQERAKLPRKRTKLYQEGIRVLLHRGARSQAFQTDYGYNNLTQPEKLTLLSKIADKTFQKDHFYFEKEEVLLIIRDYLFNSPDSCPDPETLWLRSEAVLRAIQVQHGFLVEQAKGIYCFSHVTFQEYLTARQWANNEQLALFNPEKDTLDILAQRLSDPHWQTVIGLTLSLVSSADDLLQQLKENINQLIVKEPILLQAIAQLEVKTQSLVTNHKPSAIRAFYLGLLYGYGFKLATQLDPSLGPNLDSSIALDVQLNRLLSLSASLVTKPDFEQYLSLGFALDTEPCFGFPPTLENTLKILKEQLPDRLENKDKLFKWWRENGPTWHQSLEQLIYEHRYQGSLPKLTKAQRQRLGQYYHSLIFLLTVSRGDCQVTPVFQESLEEGILAQISETS